MICRVCDSTELVPAIDLGLQPWCNDFLTPEQVGREPYYPLRVVYCRACEAAQLDYTVGKEIMFGNHTYLSGVTRSLSQHFEQVAREADSRFLKGAASKSVLDIGSNDGTQLKHYQSLGYDVLGVESSRRTAEIANAAGVPTFNGFFNADVVRQIGKRFDLINAAGIFFHLEELHSATDGIRAALKDDGVFIVQFLYMKRIVENGAFDQIYHEHLLYYNLRTIERLLQRHGLEMFDAYLSPIHGGSIIGFVSHRGSRAIAPRLESMRAAEDQERCNTLAWYQNFQQRIAEMKQENLRFLHDAKAKGQTVWGFGAPVKGNTLLNYFGIGPDVMDCLVEKNELRRGLFAPGNHIPVVIEKELTSLPDIYYVLAWNFKREILSNNQQLIDRGIRFYFPVDPKDA